MGRMSTLFRRRARDTTPPPASINEPLTDEEEGTLRAAFSSLPRASRNYNWFAKRARPERQDTLVRYQLSDDVLSSDDFQVAGSGSDSSGIFTSVETPDSIDQSTPQSKLATPPTSNDPETKKNVDVEALTLAPQNSVLNEAIQEYINRSIETKVNSMISQLVTKIVEQQRLKRTNRLSCISTFSTLSLEQDQAQGLWPIQEHEPDSSDSTDTADTPITRETMDSEYGTSAQELMVQESSVQAPQVQEPQVQERQGHELQAPGPPILEPIIQAPPMLSRRGLESKIFGPRALNAPSNLASVRHELPTISESFSVYSEPTNDELDPEEYVVDLADTQDEGATVRVSSPAPNVLLTVTRRSTPPPFRASFCASNLRLNELDETISYLPTNPYGLPKRMEPNKRRFTEPFSDLGTLDSEISHKLAQTSNVRLPEASVLLESRSEQSPNSIFTADYDTSAFETSPEVPDLSPSDHAKICWTSENSYNLDVNNTDNISSDSGSIDEDNITPMVAEGKWPDIDVPTIPDIAAYSRRKSLPVIYGQSLVHLSDTHYGYYVHPSPRPLSVGYVSPYPVPLMGQPVYYATSYREPPSLLPIDEMFEFELPPECVPRKRQPLSSRYKRWQDPANQINETAREILRSH